MRLSDTQRGSGQSDGGAWDYGPLMVGRTPALRLSTSPKAVSEACLTHGSDDESPFWSFRSWMIRLRLGGWLCWRCWCSCP